jgi:hypothetical protein
LHSQLAVHLPQNLSQLCAGYLRNWQVPLFSEKET